MQINQVYYDGWTPRSSDGPRLVAAPAPAAIAIFLAGLAAFGVMRRRAA
jgi:hypothetical protein